MNFTEATAQQLAWARGRDEPNEQDHKDAGEMVARIQARRAAMGLSYIHDVDDLIVTKFGDATN